MTEYVFHADAPPKLEQINLDDPDGPFVGSADYLDVWIDKAHNVTALIFDYEGVIHQTAEWTELVVIVDGEGEFELNGTKTPLRPGDFVIWPEGMAGVMTAFGRLRTICVAYPFVRSPSDPTVNVARV
jgi:hypothetical protein